MATWYLDYESGSDNNSGDSFAVDLTGIDFVSLGGTTITKVTGGLTGMAGRKIYFPAISSGRSIASVTNDTTAVLNISVANNTYTANIGGRRQTLSLMTTTTCQGITAGDTIRQIASRTPTSLSVNGIWRSMDSSLMLVGTTDTVVTDCETIWTGVTNVTVTRSTTAKVGTYSASIAIGVSFTTGKAAYFDLGSNQDFSNRQILTFWYQQTSGTNNTATSHSIKLCSDSAGATAVNTFTLPALPIYASANTAAAACQNVWIPVAIDLGSAAGSAIRSIGFYVNTDQGAQTFLIDDIRICTAPNLVQTVEVCDSAWTASANITTTTSTDRKQGTASTSIAVAAAFTTGLAAYKAMSSTNFSGMKQISFWIKQTVGTLGAAGAVTLSLCSDNAGATPVNTINIPVIGVLNQWQIVTVDTGGTLGAAIQSVAFNVVTDNGAQTFLLDNIIACKDSTSADSITLSSLVGRSVSVGAGGADTETWYPIQSIVGNQVLFDQQTNFSLATGASQGWYGPLGANYIETVYKLEATKTTPAATTSTAVQAITGTITGSASNQFVLSGGWDRTNMSTQSGYSFFDGQNGFGIGYGIAFAAFITIERIGAVRYSNGILFNGNNSIVNYCHGNGCTSNGMQPQSLYGISSDCFACNNTSGVTSQGVKGTLVRYTVNNNSSVGIVLQAANGIYTDCVLNNNNNGFLVSTTLGVIRLKNPIVRHNGTGFSLGSGSALVIENVSTFGNFTAFSQLSHGNVINGGSAIADSVVIASTIYGDIYMSGVTVTSFTTEFGAQTTGWNSRAIAARRNNTDDNHYVSAESISWTSQTSVRHTASGIAWKVNPTNTTSRYAGNPGFFSLGYYAVPVGSTTIKLWVRRDSTNIVMGIQCRAYQLPGITSDQTATISAAINTWEEISITISPTSSGVVELEVFAYGGTSNNGYFDDLTVGGVAVPLDYAFRGAFNGPLVSATASPYIINATVNNYTEVQDQSW